MTTNTIITAFISFVNENRSIEDYYSYGSLLLNTKTPKILFVDETMKNYIGENYNTTNTRLVLIDKEQCYLFQYRKELNQIYLHSDNLKKDTIEYIMTMCMKTEWVKKGIEMNPFHSSHFIWVDFGIRHVCKNWTKEEFVHHLDELQYRTRNKIRIGGIWDISKENTMDIYKTVLWYFAGGVFGGDKSSLELFANKMKQKCLDIIKTKHTLMWEVNIWYLIYKENKELFDIYPSNHNSLLIKNF